MKGFNDKKFKQEVIDCIENPTYAQIESLTFYVLDELGGFEINGLKLVKNL